MIENTIENRITRDNIITQRNRHDILAEQYTGDYFLHGLTLKGLENPLIMKSE